MVRKPVALANWKMEMTLSESLDFLRRFKDLAGALLPQVQAALFPPYTALHAMAQALGKSPIELGAQRISAGSGGAFTGEISARLATHFDPSLSQEVRPAYGGSVSGTYARELLILPELDGLGAARKGRDPEAFASLVRLIAEARVASG